MSKEKSVNKNHNLTQEELAKMMGLKPTQTPPKRIKVIQQD